MSDFVFPQGSTIEDTMIMLNKTLTWLFKGHISSQNVSSITTDKLVAGEALINTALIESLIVGTNVTMGPGATLAWSQITDADENALAAWEASGYKTWIDENGVYSGTFSGGMFQINPTGDPELESGLTVGGYYMGGWVGEALRLYYDQFGRYGEFPANIIASSGGVALMFNTETYFTSSVYFDDDSSVSFSGDVDFSLANSVTGLDLYLRFG